MPRVSAAFFAFGVLCVLIGMGWGMHMGASENFTLAPAHAHLNLVGWATMALYGTFYALTEATLHKRLAWTNFVVSALGVIAMIPALAMFLQTQNPKYVSYMVLGEVLTVLGMLIFAVSVIRELLRKRA